MSKGGDSEGVGGAFERGREVITEGGGALAQAPGAMLGELRRPGSALLRRGRLRSGLILVFYVSAGFAGALLVSRAVNGEDIDADAAVGLALGTAVGILPFLGIVYTLLFLVVQFSMTTFSPRLSLFRDSPLISHYFGFVLGLFVYCLMIGMTSTSEDEVHAIVPLSVGVLLLVALAMAWIILQSAFTSIQLATMLHQIVARGHGVIAGIYPDPYVREPLESTLDFPEPSSAVLWERDSAVIQRVKVKPFMKYARKTGTTIELTAGIGGIARRGEVIAVVHGRGEASDAILRYVTTGEERTFEQDPAWALRLLVDIGLRALSPAVNDPTTATQSLDASEGLLRDLGRRDLDVSTVTDADGRVLLVVPLPTWEDYVSLALDEMIAFGRHSPQVRARLARYISGTASAIPEDRRPALEARRAALERDDPA